MSKDSEIRELTDERNLHESNARIARQEARLEKERAEEARQIFRDSIWKFEDIARRESLQEKICRNRLKAITESQGI